MSVKMKFFTVRRCVLLFIFCTLCITLTSGTETKSKKSVFYYDSATIKLQYNNTILESIDLYEEETKVINIIIEGIMPENKDYLLLEVRVDCCCWPWR